MPKDTIPMIIDPTRVCSLLLKMVTTPPSSAIANAVMHAICKNRWTASPMLMKKDIKKTKATIDAHFCLSRSLINITVKPLKTAIMKEATAIKFLNFPFPFRIRTASEAGLPPANPNPRHPRFSRHQTSNTVAEFFSQ